MLLPNDRVAPEHRRDDRELFCAYALGDWLQAAERAGVPAVPAEEIAVFEAGDLRHHETEGPHQARLDAAYAYTYFIRAMTVTMARWDGCASIGLKALLADGRVPEPGPARQGLPIDTRLLGVLEDWPRLLMPAWQRPWIGDVQHRDDRHPREYRAFVRNGELIAFSAYYPQQPAGLHEDELEAVSGMTRKLAETLRGPFRWPTRIDADMRARHLVRNVLGRVPKGSLEAGGVHFTADFTATIEGVLLLEGGPPAELGAQPCCFEGTELRGVRLAAGGPVLPLPDVR